jgi:hypothetical protein
MFIKPRLLTAGLVLWLVGTAALRFAGHRLLPPGHPIVAIVLLVAGAAGSAWLVRHLCASAQLSREDWLAGAVAIVLPTLCLDAFSATFFPAVFPNIAPAAAGFFGGWMLACCAGGLIGAGLGRAAAR